MGTDNFVFEGILGRAQWWSCSTKCREGNFLKRRKATFQVPFVKVVPTVQNGFSGAPLHEGATAILQGEGCGT